MIWGWCIIGFTKLSEENHIILRAGFPFRIPLSEKTVFGHPTLHLLDLLECRSQESLFSKHGWRDDVMALASQSASFWGYWIHWITKIQTLCISIPFPNIALVWDSLTTVYGNDNRQRHEFLCLVYRTAPSFPTFPVATSAWRYHIVTEFEKTVDIEMEGPWPNL